MTGPQSAREAEQLQHLCASPPETHPWMGSARDRLDLKGFRDERLSERLDHRPRASTSSSPTHHVLLIQYSIRKSWSSWRR